MGVSPERGTLGGGLRRFFDVLGAAVMFFVTLPLLLGGLALVWVADGRPVLFGHPRVGRRGKPFRCWKVRTMAVGAEQVLERDPELRRRHRQNGFKLPDAEDPRVTRWGRWLRRTHVDELPQLFNVLRGDMSLLGPRPVVADELDRFGSGREELLEVRPGIFGPWNSLGRARPPYPERAELELSYVRDRSLRRDLEILGRSVVAVLRGQRGA